MTSTGKYLAISLITLSSGFAQSSWVPYTAQSHETFVNVSPAGVHTTIKTEGFKARSSDGNIIEQEYAPGTKKPFKERLYDARENVYYSIDFNTKLALGRSEKMGHRTESKEAAVGHETIGGVLASAHVVRDFQTHEPRGKMWIADGTDIPVRITTEFPNGASYTLELSDVHIGQEPEASLFTIPSDMQVSKPTKP